MGSYSTRPTPPPLPPPSWCSSISGGRRSGRSVSPNVIEANGRHIPTRFEVHDLLSEGSSTVAVWQDYDFDAEISESCFSQQAP